MGVLETKEFRFNQSLSCWFFIGASFCFPFVFYFKNKAPQFRKTSGQKSAFKIFPQHSFGRGQAGERWHLASAKSLPGTNKLPRHKTAKKEKKKKKKTKTWITGVACAGTLSRCFSKMQTSASAGFCVCADNARPLRATAPARQGQARGNSSSWIHRDPWPHASWGPAPAPHRPSAGQLHSKEQKNNLPRS